MLLALGVKLVLIVLAISLGISILHTVEEIESKYGEKWDVGIKTLFVACLLYFPAVVYVIIWLL